MKFLDWFIEEQQEEEDNADKMMITRMKLFGSDALGPLRSRPGKTPRASTPSRALWPPRKRAPYFTAKNAPGQ